MNKLKIEAHLPKGFQIFRLLKQAIVTLRLEPGQSLSEKDIADTLGVSRQPVREAFIKLAETGLVEIIPQRGTFIVKISIKSVKIARFIRENLELAIVKEACGKLEPIFFEKLDSNLARQELAAKEGDFEDFLLLDEAFHKSIATAVGLERVWDVIEVEKAQLDRVRFLSLPKASPMQQLIRQHKSIAQALKEENLDRCEVILGNHLAEILSVLEPLIAEFPDYFEP